MTKPTTFTPEQARRTNERFTPEQDALILAMAEHYGRADIAMTLGNKTAKQVSGRLYWLQNGMEKPVQESHVGWPVHDPRKVNDWPDFSTENVIERGTTPKRMQAPANMTLGGVGRYG